MNEEYKIEIWNDKKDEISYFIKSPNLKYEKSFIDVNLFDILIRELAEVFPREVRICRQGWAFFEPDVNHRIISLEDSYNLFSRIKRKELEGLEENIAG